MSYYYGPPPQQPRQMSGGTIALIVIGAGVGSILLLCVLCSSLSAIATRNQRISTSAPAFSTDVPLPTRPPAPTATPTPATIQGAVLGGTPDGFTKAYGSELPGLRDTWGATIEGHDVEIMVQFDTGPDGDLHAWAVGVQVPPAGLGPTPGWDPATAEAIVGHFMPPNAKFVRTDQQPKFLEYDYISPDLANSLPAKYFTADDAETPTPAGSFSWSCLPTASIAGNVDDCLMTSGWFHP